MACHYPDLGSASDWMKPISNQLESLRRSGQWHVTSMEFLRPFLRRHFAGKPLVASRKLGLVFILWNKKAAGANRSVRTGVTKTVLCLIASQVDKMQVLGNDRKEVGRVFFDWRMKRQTTQAILPARITKEAREQSPCESARENASSQSNRGLRTLPEQLFCVRK